MTDHNVLKSYRIVFLLLAFCLSLTSSGLAAQSEESQLKAVFVLNFAKLTEWPANPVDGSTVFTVAILGKLPSESFVKTLQQQMVHGVKVNIRHIETVADAKGARLLYVSGYDRQRLPGILRDLNQQNLLTVSDIPGFCEAGGMIGLVPVEKRLSFEVNLAAVRKTRMTVSSQLLKLARNIFGN